MFKVQFKTDNDAFVQEQEGEVVRILKAIIVEIGGGDTYGDLFDVNGNKIGSWYMELPDTTEEGDDA